MDQTVTTTTRCGVTVQAWVMGDHEPLVTVLTPCCKAAAKYVDTGVPGADEVFVCRGCYQPAPEYLGGVGYWVIERAATEARCAHPSECAADVLWTLDLELDRQLGRDAEVTVGVRHVDGLVTFA